MILFYRFLIAAILTVVEKKLENRKAHKFSAQTLTLTMIKVRNNFNKFIVNESLEIFIYLSNTWL